MFDSFIRVFSYWEMLDADICTTYQLYYQYGPLCQYFSYWVGPFQQVHVPPKGMWRIGYSKKSPPNLISSKSNLNPTLRGLLSLARHVRSYSLALKEDHSNIMQVVLILWLIAVQCMQFLTVTVSNWPFSLNFWFTRLITLCPSLHDQLAIDCRLTAPKSIDAHL